MNLRELLDQNVTEGMNIMRNALSELEARPVARAVVQKVLANLSEKTVEALSEVVQIRVEELRRKNRTPAEMAYVQTAIDDHGSDEIEFDDARTAEVVETGDGAWVTAYIFVEASAAGVGQLTLSDEDTYAQCENCDRRFQDRSQMDTSINILINVQPGEIMPAGRCPHCGALVYVNTATKNCKEL